MAEAAQSLLALAGKAPQRVEMIGALQRTIAYTVIADGGQVADGSSSSPSSPRSLVNAVIITAVAHGLKKNQTIYLATQAAGTEYIGTYGVYAVIDADHFMILATFGVTRAGNINLTASLNGYGFIADGALTIAEFVPESPYQDTAAVIARTYAAGDEIPIRFKKIRITAGNLRAIREQPRAVLDYTNR